MTCSRPALYRVATGLLPSLLRRSESRSCGRCSAQPIEQVLTTNSSCCVSYHGPICTCAKPADHIAQRAMTAATVIQYSGSRPHDFDHARTRQQYFCSLSWFVTPLVCCCASDARPCYTRTKARERSRSRHSTELLTRLMLGAPRSCDG